MFDWFHFRNAVREDKLKSLVFRGTLKMKSSAVCIFGGLRQSGFLLNELFKILLGEKLIQKRGLWQEALQCWEIELMTDRIKLKAKYCIKYFVKLKKN